MIILKAGERRTVSIDVKDEFGNPLRVEEPITWVSTDNSIITPSTIPNTPAYDCVLVSPTGKVGTCQVVASIDTDLTPNGSVDTITVLDGGSMYEEPPTVTFSPPPQTMNAFGVPIVQNGTIIGVDFQNYLPGAGYLIAPLITFSAPAKGVTATGVATISGGQIVDVAITNGGSGYLPNPTAQIPAPAILNPNNGTYEDVVDGVSAIGIPVVQNGQVIGVNVVFKGEKYPTTGTANRDVIFSLPAGFPVGFPDNQKEAYRAKGTITIGSDGKVSDVVITYGGGYYTAGPTVSVTPAPTGNRTPVAVAVLNGDKVSSIRILNRGKGYITPPTVIIDGPERPASASAVMSGGKLIYIDLTDPGLAYTQAPTVTIDPPSTLPQNRWGTKYVQATAEATVNPQTGRVTGITITNPGKGYITTPAITIASPILTFTATATATITPGVNNHIGRFDVTVIPAETYDVNLSEKNIVMNAGETTTLHVVTVDKFGNPSAVNGAPKWELFNENICSITVSDDGTSCDVVSNGKVGFSQVLVKADVDLTDGKYYIIDLCNLEVKPGQNQNITINQ